jgi:hypothetical protein
MATKACSPPRKLVQISEHLPHLGCTKISCAVKTSPGSSRSALFRREQLGEYRAEAWLMRLKFWERCPHLLGELAISLVSSGRTLHIESGRLKSVAHIYLFALIDAPRLTLPTPLCVAHSRAPRRLWDTPGLRLVLNLGKRKLVLSTVRPPWHRIRLQCAIFSQSGPGPR